MREKVLGFDMITFEGNNVITSLTMRSSEG